MSNIAKELKLAKSDMIAANILYKTSKKEQNNNLHNLVSYHIEQAVEKLILVQITNSNIPKNTVSTINIDIFTLLNISKYYKVKLNIPELIINNRQELADWQLRPRYDYSMKFSTSKLEIYLETLEKWYSELEIIYNSNL